MLPPGHPMAQATSTTNEAAITRRILRSIRAANPSLHPRDARGQYQSMSAPKRNDPCHCGSGAKYKRCHLIRDYEGELRGPRPGEGEEE